MTIRIKYYIKKNLPGIGRFGRGFPVRGHVLVDDCVVDELILTIVLKDTFDCGVINAVADLSANTNTNSIL